jgi:excisionase family DNA binding protein
LSLAEAAKRLGLSYFTVREMLLDGRLSGGRIKRKRRSLHWVSPASVAAFLSPAAPTSRR